MADRNPQNFLIHLRNSCAPLARRMDGVRTLGLGGGVLTLKVDTASWPGSELVAGGGELEGYAAGFFGDGTSVAFDEAAPDPQRLPFPINASKVWNHVSFISVASDHPVGVLSVRKRDYANWVKTGWVKTGEPGEGGEQLLLPASGATGIDSLIAAMPQLVDQLCAMARENRSYAQLVMRFPGDVDADRIEGALYSVKEWGTPETPGPIFQKFLGRIHYVDPCTEILGLKLADQLIGVGGAR